MKKSNKKPQLYIIAGPNGSGKTTFAKEFLPYDAGCLEFVNVDMIAGGLSPFAPQRAAIRAGRLVLEQIHLLGNRGLSFAFETTLSGKTYIKLLKDLKEKGYQIHLYFLWILTVELALELITTRVKSGGHDVPELVVRRRFNKSLTNFFKHYQPLVDSWAIYDNSGEKPQMIVFKELGGLKIIDSILFNTLVKNKGKQ
jgi:predicted ABC-type ATPase